MTAWTRALRGTGWGRAALVAMALGLLLALTGLAELIFYRPYGYGARAQVPSDTLAFRVGLTSILHLAHLVAAAGFTLAVVALVLLARPWQRGGPGPARAPLALAAVLTAALVATGLVTPWERLLPWSASMGANMARPMPLGQQGPFAELVGVNARYDEAMFTLAGRRLGARATGRAFFAHVLVLPVLTVAAAVIVARRRRARGA